MPALAAPGARHTALGARRRRPGPRRRSWGPRRRRSRLRRRGGAGDEVEAGDAAEACRARTGTPRRGRRAGSDHRGILAAPAIVGRRLERERRRRLRATRRRRCGDEARLEHCPRAEDWQSGSCMSVLIVLRLNLQFSLRDSSLSRQPHHSSSVTGHACTLCASVVSDHLTRESDGREADETERKLLCVVKSACQEGGRTGVWSAEDEGTEEGQKEQRKEDNTAVGCGKDAGRKSGGRKERPSRRERRER